MRKFMVVVLVISLCVAFVGCGSTQHSFESKVEAKPAPASQKKAEEIKSVPPPQKVQQNTKPLSEETIRDFFALAAEDENKYIREKAFSVLKKISPANKKAVEYFAAEVRGRVYARRIIAIILLGEIKPRSNAAVIHALFKVFRGREEDEILRLYAGWALVRIGEQQPAEEAGEEQEGPKTSSRVI